MQPQPKSDRYLLGNLCSLLSYIVICNVLSSFRVIKLFHCYADESPQYHVRAAHGSSSASEEDTLNHQGPSLHPSGPVHHLHEHSLSQRYRSHGCQQSHQPPGHMTRTSRGFSSSSHYSSRSVYGIASPHAAAALRLEQGPAGSSCCSTRGFASMPGTALQRDSQHGTGSATQRGRGFASASEPAQQSAAPAAEPAQQAFVPPGRVQNAPAPPWTPTRELRKRNFLPRRMGHLMEVHHHACSCFLVP